MAIQHAAQQVLTQAQGQRSTGGHHYDARLQPLRCPHQRQRSQPVVHVGDDAVRQHPPVGHRGTDLAVFIHRYAR